MVVYRANPGRLRRRRHAPIVNVVRLWLRPVSSPLSTHVDEFGAPVGDLGEDVSEAATDDPPAGEVLVGHRTGVETPGSAGHEQPRGHRLGHLGA